MSKTLRLMLLFLFPFVLSAVESVSVPPIARPSTPEESLKSAHGLKEKGQFKEALELYRKVALDPQVSGRLSVSGIQSAVECLYRLNLPGDVEPLLESAATLHARDWRVLQSAARFYRTMQSSGFLIDGKYIRGWHRGGGRWINTAERDRIRSLQWLEQARLLGTGLSGDDRKEFGSFLQDYAQTLESLAMSPQQSWRLQIKTDLTTLPPLENEADQSSATSGAPVDQNGVPVLYKIPADFNSAASDGERVRWLRAEAVRVNPDLELAVLKQHADALQNWFGVQTLSDQPFFFRTPPEDADSITNRFVLHTLGDKETIARLAVGIRRFSLPDDHNPISLYRRIADTAAARNSNPVEAAQALGSLASIYENRRQYDKAADCLRDCATRYDWNRPHMLQKLNQIIGNWGEFEPVGPQTAVNKPSFEFRFRNGRNVAFEARVIDVPLLLQDLKAYLKSNPRELDWNQLQINNLGWRLLQTNQTRYVGAVAAEWARELQPRAGHFDSRLTVQAPIEKNGAYWLTSRMENGNTNHLVLWVQDTVIVQKQMAGTVLLYVADAESGKPVPGAAVDAFGYRTEWKEEPGGARGRQVILTDGFTAQSDQDGLVISPAGKSPNMSWLYTATTGDGRMAFLGFANQWFSEHAELILNDIKCYLMTDRPVYRPNQLVHFKAWVSRVSYDLPPQSEFAGKSFVVLINDPQGEKLFETKITADAQGGLAGDWMLAKDAKLGMYSITVGQHHGGAFRVEEYKKPEFDVTVEAPADPVALGDAFEAVVKARYYFGAPVTEARVKWKVIRKTYSVNWFPPGPWDWLYGKGYGWLGIDYPMYPGWERWGCFRPFPWWRPTPYTPPEVIAENTVPIGPDGTVRIPIDTAVAKEVFGNTDHEYSISVEVTDASRRTISGSGRVIAAREPFKVYAWTHRGYYRSGDTILASFSARRPDGKAVAGRGKVRLLRVSYQDETPRESTVQEWPVELDEDGDARIQMTAAEAGQYRLSATITSPRGKTIEGASIVTVRGESFTGTDFHFNDIELTVEKATYAPDEKVNLLIQSDRANGTVLLFSRPVQGIYEKPEVVRLAGKSAERGLTAQKKDMPNFYVEVLTVHAGKVHTETREIMVPPEKRVLNVTVEPTAETVKPGAVSKVTVKATTMDGKPAMAALALTVYDKAVEYISGGSNIPEIREFFWKWRRHHTPAQQTSVDGIEGPVDPLRAVGMQNLGIFGDSVADEEGVNRSLGKRRAGEMKGMGGGFAGSVRKSAMTGDSANGIELAAAPMMAMDKDVAFSMADAEAAPGGEGDDAQVAVRKEFADTAFWSTALVTDQDGKAEVSFPMPENLGEWVARSWAFGPGAVVGENSAKIVTTKNLLVRLQAPRFFLEKDEVVLSGNIHNTFATDRTVRAILELEGGTLTVLDKVERRVKVKAGGETRVDWRVKVGKEGKALVRMKALAEDESDAMQMDFPVYVHGMLKTEAWSAAIRNDAASAVLSINVPAERRPDQTLLEVRWSPTLAGAMVDALPYLAAYPYGCIEQTLNRFIPTVITRRILEKSGLDLEAIRLKRNNLNAQERGDPQKRAEGWKRFPDNPVFDKTELDQMVKNGISRLADMQNGDGGWNWFSGWQGESSCHITAQIVHGLLIARTCGVAVPDANLQNGITWLETYANQQIVLLKEAAVKKDKPWKESADNLDALAYRVLVEAGKDPVELRDFLYRDRLNLSLYGQALLGLSLAQKNRKEELDMVLKNIGQFVEQDEENQTAWLRMNNNGTWWYWFGDEIEAHAAYLKLLSMTDPKGELASRFVKYLLNNRKHATYWKSTRDTAWCIEALADFLAASSEGKPDMSVSVLLDGKPVSAPVKVTADNLFTIDTTFSLAGPAVSSGPHKVEVVREGKGPVYINTYLENFTLEDPIKAAGLEVKIRRKLFKLTEADKNVAAAGSSGQVVGVRVDRYERHELKNGDDLKSGDLVEIELLLDSKNDYEYLVVEDMKAAGFEPVEVRSGYGGNELGAYMEFRDERVCLFLKTLARGSHSVSYRVRAEIPGRFSVMPSKIWGMYAPELRGNSDEQKIGIKD
jgi:uncharacterized protein YfaS (alpha-2-macroglobulin family)